MQGSQLEIPVYDGQIELVCDCCGVHFRRSGAVHRGRLKQGYKHTFCCYECAQLWPATMAFTEHYLPKYSYGDATLATKRIRELDPRRTGASIARELGISKERVRQILNRLGLPTVPAR